MDKDLAALLSMNQQVEQALAAMEQLATLIHAYYDNLIDRGLSKEDAMALATELQRTIVTQKQGE